VKTPQVTHESTGLLSSRRAAFALVLALLPGLLLPSCRTADVLAPRSKPAHTVKPAEDWTRSSDEGQLDPFVPRVNPLGAAGNQTKIEAAFAGTARKAAKISISSAPMQTFNSLHTFLNSLPDDQDMIAMGIPKSATSGRVAEEERNVSIPVWVYAIKWEEDHDWHIIVGSDPDDGNPVYFNVEISGLPPKSSVDYNTLLGARQDLADVLDNDLPGGSGYWAYEPFPVRVKGSLFYDVSHAPGVVGPGSLKPDTAWEIHPVTDFAWR